VLVIMENHTYGEVAGSSPTLNRLASDCGLATNYSAIRHPSLPNYLALTSGTTNGVTRDCTRCETQATSIFEQLHGDWRSYLESLPKPGYRGPVAGTYAKKHNPAAYYTQIAGAYRHDAVPLGRPSGGALARDLRRNGLTRFSLIVPNLCNDEHDCSIASGDRWLGRWVPLILDSPAYRSGFVLLLITYDEGNGPDNRVYTVAANPSIRPGTIISTSLNHYSLLKTSQELLGLPCTAHTCDGHVHSMLPSLGLRAPRVKGRSQPSSGG
jgi:phospholipase C